MKNYGDKIQMSQAKYREEILVCKRTGKEETHLVQYHGTIEYKLCQCEIEELEEENKALGV